MLQGVVLGGGGLSTTVGAYVGGVFPAMGSSVSPRHLLWALWQPQVVFVFALKSILDCPSHKYPYV